jgi:hypothetical protein
MDKEYPGQQMGHLSAVEPIIGDRNDQFVNQPLEVA